MRNVIVCELPARCILKRTGIGILSPRRPPNDGHLANIEALPFHWGKFRPSPKKIPRKNPKLFVNARHDSVLTVVEEPKAIYMLKPSPEGESIEINRIIKVICEDDGAFVVLVTDRDYFDDSTGQTQTIVFRESRASIDIATAEAQRWVITC